jgi:LmbE family N-acetylglucosaminyl deacetylase
MSAERTILISFAHPDDETFLTGGVASKYADQGVRVVLSVATLGEAGKMGDPPICAPEQLPEVRERELRAAVQILGIADVHLLGYRDRELASANPDTIRSQLVGLIRRCRPQVVITFDPNGTNLHPDHIAISRFTSDALAAAADPRWLPAAEDAHEVHRLVWMPRQRPWQMARLPALRTEPSADFVIDTARWARRKAEALRAHRTQQASANRNFFSQPDADRLLSIEVFRQAWGPHLVERPADDLFSGIDA